MKLISAPFFLAMASAASAAVVDLNPPGWERWDPGNGQNNQFAIHAVWEFGANTNPVGPDNEAVIVANPIHCPLCTNEIAVPTGNASWNSGFDLSGQWLFSSAGQIDGQLTNVIDTEPLKLMQTQITWIGALANAPVFVVTSAFDPSVGGTGTIPIDGGVILNLNPSGTHTLIDDFGTPDPNDDQWVGIYNVEISPNPNNENFRIDMSPGTAIDGIIIDTVSIPEPTSALLLGLGGFGLLLRRRRS